MNERNHYCKEVDVQLGKAAIHRPPGRSEGGAMRGACRAGSRPQADIDEAKRGPRPMCASLAGRTDKR